MKPLIDCIQKFHPLKADSVNALIERLVKNEFRKNEILAKENTVCNKLSFIEKGCVRGFFNEDGKEVTAWFAFENNFVTSFYSFISRKPAVENIEAIEDLVLYSINYNDLQALFDNYPDIERLVRIVYERYYIMLEERIISFQFKNATERYENLLSQNPFMLNRLPLGYIASYLGISQETLSRIRGKV